MKLKISLDSAHTRYLLELVYADKARMRQLTEHAKSRGEFGFKLVPNTTATEIEETLLAALGISAIDTASGTNANPTK